MCTNSQISQPRIARDAQEAEVGDRGVAADRRHVAGVEVAKRRRRLAGDQPRDVARRVRALLLRDLRHARQRLARLMRERRQVADDEDAGMARAPTGRARRSRGRRDRGRPEIARQRRRRDAGGPEDRVRLDPLVADPHRALFDLS